MKYKYLGIQKIAYTKNNKLHYLNYGDEVNLTGKDLDETLKSYQDKFHKVESKDEEEIKENE